jgi:predicted transcriptional regulator
MYMIQNVDEISRMRKQLGLTQKELADASGVSQSMIAKIESGRLDPGFSHVKQIFAALEQTSTKDMVYAKDVMAHPVKYISADNTIMNAVRIMRKQGYSQLPVRAEGVVGTLTERALLDALLKRDAKISDIMLDAPPTVSPDTPVQAVIDLLHYFSMVLVVKKGKNVGVITKTDVLSNIKR